MIKQALAQGDIPYLNKLYDAYATVNDEKEILKVGGKLIQKVDKLNNIEKLINIFDRIYEIITKQRKIFRSINDMEITELRLGNKRKVKYMKEYKDYLASSVSETLKKLIKDIKKGLARAINSSRETEIFLQLNLSDYSRYLCEVTISQHMKQEYIIDTDCNYKKLFALLDDSNIKLVNPSSLTGHYHYAIFIYEIKDKKAEAIKYLKERHIEIIDSLDTAYKLYVDSYPLLDMLTDTLTSWVINTNYVENNL